MNRHHSHHDQRMELDPRLSSQFWALQAHHAGQAKPTHAPRRKDPLQDDCDYRPAVCFEED